MSGGNNLLPDTWVKVRLADIVKPTRPKHSPQDFPALQFIGMENVEAHTMKLLGTVPASSMRSNAVHFQPGDVLYGRLRPYLNKVYCPNFEGLCSAEFIVFPPRDWIQSKFLQYFLNSSAFVSFATHLNAGDRPRVDFDQIGEYQIPLVPVHEQKRIVAEIEKQFTRLGAAVGALKRAQANLKRYRAAVLKAACEGRLVPTEAELARREGRSYETGSVLLDRILAERRARWEEEQLRRFAERNQEPPKNWSTKYQGPTETEEGELPQIASHWVFASADSVCSSVRDGTHDTPAYVEHGVPLVTSKNLLPTGLDFSDVQFISDAAHREISKRSGVARGDVLFAMIGTVGNPVVVNTDREFSIKNVGLFKSNIPGINPSYLCYWLSSPQLKTWLKPKQKGTTQKFVPLGLLRALPIALAPLKEQESIVKAIDRQFSVIEHLQIEVETKLRSAQTLRQSILKRAFEGKLVHQDPNDEPANVLLERICCTAIPGCAPGKHK